MSESCHRCHAELPERKHSGGPYGREEASLFCPYCSAPQLLLPEHMRVVPGMQAGDVLSTGTPPPPPESAPSARSLDWRAAILSGAAVACVGALLTVSGLRFGLASFVGIFWVMGAGIIAQGLYHRLRRAAAMDGRLGLQFGFVTGLLMVAALGIALGITGLAVRFGAHGMQTFDTEWAKQFAVMQKQMVEKMQQQGQAVDVQQRVLGFMDSAEVRAGLSVMYLMLLGFFVIVFSTGGGAFAGLLRDARARQHRLRPRD